MSANSKLVDFFAANNIEAAVRKGQLLVEAPIRRVANLIARRGATPKARKMGTVSDRANARERLLSFRVATPKGTFKFERAANTLTYVTLH